MAVKIGHAALDERGKITGGTAGDQTGSEVCIRTWYSKPWDFVLRCKDSSKAEKMAIACEQGCANEKIGYNQSKRNTLYIQAQNVNYDLSKITAACECDCSSFLTVCALAAGIPIPYGSNAPTTSTMKTVFTNTGEFDVFTESEYLTKDTWLKRGDLLVKAGIHTAMVLENGANAIPAPVPSSPLLKCVDVSSYQGDINWNQVKAAGVHHAILKVIRKDLNPDTKFEQNWENCRSANVTVNGVYNYSYATTVEKAKSDAQKVLSILNGRACTVWLDVEDKSLQGIGSRLKDLINAYRDVIVNAGYDFGIYTGMAFYNAYLKPYVTQIHCDNFWIARYYNSYQKMDVSTNPKEQYNPKTSVGREIFAWQYTSSGQVPGVSGNVDLSMIYGDIQASSNTPATSPATISETPVELLGKINTASANLNIRSAPNTSSPIVGSYKKGILVQLKAKTATNWYRTDKGYISGAYVVAAKGIVFNCTKLNMRKEPKVETGNIVSVLHANDDVELLQEAGGWYKVKTKNNLVGYVSGKYITLL